MRGWWIAVAVLGALSLVSVGSSGCVDTEGGDFGTYGSPCAGGFGDLLRCSRESGGADPETGDPDPGQVGDDCVELCEILCQCFGCESSEETECVGDCRQAPLPPQDVECIKQNRCNLEICFPEQF